MGLAYFFLFIMILGAAGIAVTLLIAAWEIWKKVRFKINHFYRIIHQNTTKTVYYAFLGTMIFLMSTVSASPGQS